jgi:multiple sugar transport system permease protein
MSDLKPSKAWMLDSLRKLVTLAVMIFSISPVVLLALDSFKSYSEIVSLPMTILPRNPTLNNFIEIEKIIPLVRMTANTFFVAGSITLSTVLLGTLAGYAFAKLHFRGREKIFMLTLSKLMIPVIVLVIPWMFMISRMGLLDSLWAIVLPNLSGAWTVFFMRQYISQLPNELLDSARIDGASELRIFYRIVLPLIKPALAAATIVNFLSGWNEFVWPLLALTSKSNFLLSIGVSYVKYSGGQMTEGTVNYGMLAAFSLFYSLPLLLAYLVLARQFVESIVFSGLKR